MSASKATEEALRSVEALRIEIRDELAALERYEAQNGEVQLGLRRRCAHREFAENRSGRQIDLLNRLGT
jgi:hypothetical protein